MADVITRFKLETTQYDSKLRDASKGLAEYTRQATLSGNEFGKFTQKNIEAARALGTITPSATNAKDKVKELVGAFNDAAKAYNALTKEQQQSDFGKAMAESISQLSDKIREAKRELYDMGDAAKKSGGGGLFSGMGDKMSGALQVFAGNMLTKAAGAVAELGSEIFASVQQGVELARQGEGIRIAFERLGRGDILEGLRQATHGTVTDLELMKAAVKFNDFKLPLDELGTMLQFAQQKAKDTGQSVDYMTESIVNGLGRKSLMILDNLGLSAAEIKEKMAETGDMTKAVGAIIREQMSKAGDYVETAADRAAQANVSLQNKMEELGRKFAPVEEASSQLWTSMKIGILDIIGGPLATLLNQLTEAGRLKNQLNNMNGEPGSGNTKVDQQLKKLNVIKKGGGSDYIFNATLNGMLEDYNRQIMALDAQIKNGGKRPGAGSGESQDVKYLQQKMDALKIMRDQLAAGAKELSKPVDVKIDTKVAEQNVESLKVKLIELEAQRKKAIAAGDTDLSKNIAKQISQVKSDIKGLGGTTTTTTTTHKATPQETAANKVKEAERTYAETLLKNSIRMEAGMDTTLEYKKRELSAQERLFDAYNDAYATYQDPAYKKASMEAAEKIRALAGEVKAASDAQEAAKKSARELDTAQRKLADAQQKLAEARATGSATAVYKAQQEVDKRQKVVEQVQYVADVKAGKMPTLPENMKAEMVVTANTDEAVRALQAIQGIKIDSKSFTVSTDDADAMARLREIRGIKIAPKSFTVSTDDADAMARLREIRGIKIDSKSFTVSTDDADAMARLREIDGVTIDDKTLTVTATTDEAVQALQAIQGVTIRSKSFDISTDDADALAKVSEIDGVTIGPKTFTVTADDEDVLAKLREILDKLSEIQGVTIDTKTFTISTDNEEALAKVREIQDLTIDPKTVKIVQETQGEKSSFDNLVETVQAEIKFDQMKVDETALHTLLQTALQNGLDGLALSYEGIQEKIAKGIDIPDSTWEELTNEINDKLKDLGIEPIEIPIETTEKNVKAITKAARITADVVGSIGDAFNAIEDPAAKVMGTVMQAIASVALGYAQATAQASSMGPWAWIAFAAAGLATMISTISAIHSATGYAEGGMIKGNSYSGDNIGGLVDGSQFVGLNAGEVVLNASQQNALAQQITGGGMGNVNLTGRLRGTDIILSVDRSLQSMGRGLASGLSRSLLKIASSAGIGPTYFHSLVAKS